MKSLCCVLLLICATACEYRSGTVRPYSPFRATVGQSSSAAAMRAGIFAVIPVGSTRQKAEEAIKANFDTTVVTTTVPTNAPKKLHPGAARIEIELFVHGSFGGKDETYARFIFDEHDKLADVLIYSVGSWI